MKSKNPVLVGSVVGDVLAGIYQRMKEFQKTAPGTARDDRGREMADQLEAQGAKK